MEEKLDVQIHPSPSVLARADASIAECVRLMKNHGVGSVLIVEDRDQGDLVGIFTERDLLEKIDLIQGGDHWYRPVRTVMSSPVITVDVSELSQAGWLMLRHKIRHLPIVETSAGTEKKTLVGVISMRDLFRDFINQGSVPNLPLKSEASGLRLRRLGIVSNDEVYVSFLKKLINYYCQKNKIHAEIERVKLNDCPLVIVDLDHLKTKEWTEVLKKKNHDPNLKRVFILFDPTLQSEEVKRVLKLIGTSDKFLLLKKPIDVLGLVDALSGW